jgi:hypothetical protein
MALKRAASVHNPQPDRPFRRIAGSARAGRGALQKTIYMKSKSLLIVDVRMDDIGISGAAGEQGPGPTAPPPGSGA